MDFQTSSKLRRKNPQAELKNFSPHNISIWDFQNYFVMGGVKIGEIPKSPFPFQPQTQNGKKVQECFYKRYKTI